MTTTDTCSKPDYAMAQQAAYDTLESANINTLPVDLRRIVDKYDDLSLMKYTTVAKKTNVSVYDVIRLLQSEEGCLFRNDHGKYIIFYNDTVEYNPRVRFTIAHEIGHYVMSHLGSEETTIARHALRKVQEKYKEQEANYFARRLLAPIPAVDLYGKAWNKLTGPIIHRIFDTSLQVSGYVINDLNRRLENTCGVIFQSHPLQDQFKDHVQSQAQAELCQNCKGIQTSTGESGYCSICGSIDLKKIDADTFLTVTRTGGWDLKYSKIEVDERGKAHTCPVCENEEIEDNEEICMICGTYVRNICTGLDRGPDEYGGLSPDDFQGCQVNLKGNARYCTKCGALSTFYYYDILKQWSKEYQESQKEGIPF